MRYMKTESETKMSDLKRRVKEMVGQPVPANMLEGVNWGHYESLAPTERDAALSRLAATLREKVSGSENPDKILLG